MLCMYVCNVRMYACNVRMYACNVYMHIQYVWFILFMTTGAIARATHKITGEISCGTQYHFTMETQVCVCVCVCVCVVCVC